MPVTAHPLPAHYSGDTAAWLLPVKALAQLLNLQQAQNTMQRLLGNLLLLQDQVEDLLIWTLDTGQKPCYITIALACDRQRAPGHQGAAPSCREGGHMGPGSE